MKENIISKLTTVLSKEEPKFYTAVRDNAEWLKPLLAEIVQRKTKKTHETKALIADLEAMIVEHKPQEKYETHPTRDIYLTWLQLLNPRLDQPAKEKLCQELLQRFIDSKADNIQHKSSLGATLSYMPLVIVAPLLLYSPLKILSSYSNYQKKYGTFSSELNDEHFEETLTFLIDNTPLFAQETLTFFLNKIVTMFKQLGQQVSFYSDKPEFLLHEAIASWEKNSLTTFLAKSFDQELQVEYHKFHEAVQKKIDNTDANLSLFSQVDVLVFEKLLTQYINQPEKLTSIVIRMSNDKALDILGKIYTAHGLNKFSMFKQHLIELAKATNAVDHYEFSSLFFSNCLKYLGNEAQSIADEIASVLSADYYVKNAYAFTPIRKEMFMFWIDHSPEKISEIVKAILSLPKHQHETPIEHFFFDLSYAKMTEDFYDKFSILLSEKLTPDQFIKVYAASPEAIQYKLLRSISMDDNNALANLKNLSTTYNSGNFSAMFLRNIAKQLKIINPKLSQQAEDLKLFSEEEIKDDLESDLHLLAKILANESLTHDERRSEIRRLKNLHHLLGDKNTDTCPIVIKMFHSISQQYWSDLFTYFDAQIIHWSFPQDEKHLRLFYPDKDKRPAPRKNTWLNFKSEWENILYGALVAVLADISKDDLRESIAHWALSYLDQAFKKSETYFPGMADAILKKFFLNNAPESIKIFKALNDQFNDKYNAPVYFSQKGIYSQVASWLPENSSSRVLFLVNLLKLDPRFEQALRIPFIRNPKEIAEVAFTLVNTRTEHIVNFIQRYRGDIANILFKSMHQLDSHGVLSLMQTALADMSKANLSNVNYLQLAASLLSLSKNAEMDIFQIIDFEGNKDFLLKTLLVPDASELASIFYPPYQLMFEVVNHYQPEELQNLIVSHVQYHLNKDNFSQLCYCIKDAQKIMGKQFQLPEAVNKLLIDYLTQKIAERYLSGTEIEVMAHFIPNFSRVFVTSKAKETIVHNSLSSTQKGYLDNLVKCYDFESINAICLELKLTEYSAYLVETFSKCPDILQQIDKAIDVYDHFFAEHQHEIDQVTRSIFNNNLKSAMTEAAKDGKSTINIAEICRKSEIAPELAALMPALKLEKIKEEKAHNFLSWVNFWSKDKDENKHPLPTNTSLANRYQR